MAFGKRKTIPIKPNAKFSYKGRIIWPHKLVYMSITMVVEQHGNESAL